MDKIVFWLIMLLESPCNSSSWELRRYNAVIVSDCRMFPSFCGQSAKASMSNSILPYPQSFVMVVTVPNHAIQKLGRQRTFFVITARCRIFYNADFTFQCYLWKFLGQWNSQRCCHLYQRKNLIEIQKTAVLQSGTAVLYT